MILSIFLHTTVLWKSGGSCYIYWDFYYAPELYVCCRMHIMSKWKFCVHMKKNVYSALVWSVLRCQLVVLFKSCKTLVIFGLLVLSIIDKGQLKYILVSVDLFSPAVLSALLHAFWRGFFVHRSLASLKPPI